MSVASGKLCGDLRFEPYFAFLSENETYPGKNLACGRIGICLTSRNVDGRASHEGADGGAGRETNSTIHPLLVAEINMAHQKSFYIIHNVSYKPWQCYACETL